MAVKSSVLAGVGLTTRRLEEVDGDEKNRCFARRCTMGDLLRLEGRRAATFGMRLGKLLMRHARQAFANSSESM